VASATGASQFARKASFAPTPQPGKYPIVFPSGAGEPTRDSTFALDGCSMEKCFGRISENYVNSARYAEFSANASYGDFDFHKDVVAAAICALTQQIVHSHANMGLSVGDFSAIASTDTYAMSSIRSIVSQFGEFSVESLGTRYLLADYASEVKALVRTAHLALAQENAGAVSSVMKMHWLPASASDPRTAFIVAAKLSGYIQQFGIHLPVKDLASAVFSGTLPPAFIAVKSLLPEDMKGRFDGLFKGYSSKAEFTAIFSGSGGKETLQALGLVWPSPAANSLNWEIVPKVRFPEIVDKWSKKKASITKFFSCGTGLAERSSACGTAAQISSVAVTQGVTVVKSLYAISAPEFSLLACFPASVHSEFPGDLNVVLTTSIPVHTRATEFTQLDWLG